MTARVFQWKRGRLGIRPPGLEPVLVLSRLAISPQCTMHMSCTGNPKLAVDVSVNYLPCGPTAKWTLVTSLTSPSPADNCNRLQEPSQPFVHQKQSQKQQFRPVPYYIWWTSNTTHKHELGITVCICWGWIKKRRCFYVSILLQELYYNCRSIIFLHSIYTCIFQLSSMLIHYLDTHPLHILLCYIFEIGWKFGTMTIYIFFFFWKRDAGSKHSSVTSRKYGPEGFSTQ